MDITLRPYQEEILQSTQDLYRNGDNRILWYMATGLGKTYAAACLPQRFPDLFEQGMIFITHRREILFDAKERFEKAYPDKWIGLEMGEHHATGMEDIVFASTQSLGRVISDRIKKYRNRQFGIIVADEGHHVTEASTWDNILNYFRVGSKRDPDYRMPSGDAPLSLFLTATPTRNDGQSLAPFLDAVAADGGFDILYGIRNGWLTDIRARQIVDKSQVSGKELATDSEIDFLTKIVRDYCADHRTLCFARSVDQSKMLRNTLHENEIVPAAHVDAETDKDIRDHIFTWFDREKPALLTNRLVVTEGYDNPGITCLLDNGPTESTPLHLQKLGRGLRPSPDANVDAYDTAEERKRAIKESDKDALLYICTFDPTDHGMDVVASITGTENAVDAEGSLVVEEVVDYIQNVEEEQPERPIRDIDSISDLENEVRQVDLWSQTVYNEDLKTITPLQWVLEEGAASLYLEENPVASRPYEQCPVIIRFEETEDGVEKYVIEVGGYIPSLGHPRKASVNHVGSGEDLHEAIQKFDRGLKKKNPSIFNRAKRGGSQPASERQKDYMKRNGINFAQNVSEEVAELQIANYKVQRKLDKIDWNDGMS